MTTLSAFCNPAEGQLSESVQASPAENRFEPKLFRSNPHCFPKLAPELACPWMIQSLYSSAANKKTVLVPLLPTPFEGCRMFV